MSTNATTYIMVRTMKSRKDEDMVTMSKEVYGELKTKGHQPKLDVLDNECSKAVNRICAIGPEKSNEKKLI